MPLPEYPTYEELHELLADPKIGPEVLKCVGRTHGLARLYEITKEWRAAKTKVAA